MAEALGIDIGGSGIKGAPVDLATGSLVADRFRVETPHPATTEAVASVVSDVVRHFQWHGLIGATFPAVIQRGVALTAANVDSSWLGTDVVLALSAVAGAPLVVLNDADAAGLAEMRIGAGRGVPGTVVMVTFGTGIGTGLFVDGKLVPNTEFGHVEIGGADAETLAAYAVREREGLSWSKWGKRVQRYLSHLELLLCPDLIIVGGGASKKADEWLPQLELRAPVRVAALRNNAGIVGAAFAASEASEASRGERRYPGPR